MALPDISARRGRFTVPAYMAEADWDMALATMAGCVVLRAAVARGGSVIEYVATCPEFDALGVGAQVPLYAPVFNNGVRIRWERRS